MQLLRAAVMSALLLSLPIPASARQALRWYDAYQQGVRSAQQGDWASAEKLLLQAKETGPQPGRRVFTYGDSYIPFLPDYYLGLVYLRSNRSAQAEASFQLVRKQNVITPKDPEYAAFDRQSREATFNRAFAQAQQFAAAGNFDAVQARLQEALAANIDNAKVQSLARETEIGRSAKASPPPVMPEPPPVRAQPTEQSPVQTAPPVAANPPPAYEPPGTSVGGFKTPSVINPAKTTNATVQQQGVVLPQPSLSLREGILAFFSGNYENAVQLLQNAAQQPGAPAQAQVLLACAKVGLVLTGRGDAGMLTRTRTEFQSAALERYLTPADRRYISPRILQQLEGR